MKKILSLMLAAGLLSSCGSIMNGQNQDVVINTVPTGANLWVDGIPAPSTPHIAKLKRSKTHTIRIEKEGYEGVYTTIDRSFSGWVWGNIPLCGLLFWPVGVVVDLCTGGAWTLEELPERIELRPLQKTQNNR